jgi:hypothetical protein
MGFLRGFAASRATDIRGEIGRNLTKLGDLEREAGHRLPYLVRPSTTIDGEQHAIYTDLAHPSDE